MAGPHKLIPIEHALAGMTLGDDVLDRHGNVLLAGGVTLNNVTLASLRRHQIDVLSIQDHAATTVDPVIERDALAQRLQRLFRAAGSQHDATGLLRGQLVRYRLGDDA